jgi:chromosome segregation ATPase
MRIIAMGLASVALLAAEACGGSSAADNAKKDACNASSDIQTQITTIKNLTPSSTSVDQAKTALKKIDTDLHTIASAVPDLQGDLKSNLKAANAEFKTQVQEIGQSITSAESLTAAATALTDAGDSLESSYTQAFANVGC